MTLSRVLEVALGMVLIYYVLGLAISYITTEIARLTQLRAKNLASELKELLGKEEGKARFDEFIKHPWIQSLAPKELSYFWQKRKLMVDCIPAETFARTLLNLWFPDKKNNDTVSLDEIRHAINTLPASDQKEALLKAIDASLDQSKDVGRLLEAWFDDAMENIGTLYKHRARNIVIIVALIITLITGIDSISVAIGLWESDAARTELAAVADRVAQTEPNTASAGEEFKSLQAELSQLAAKTSFPVGWSIADREKLSQLEPNFLFWKVLGLLVTWVAIAQGSSFWYQILKGIRERTEAPKEEEASPRPISEQPVRLRVEAGPPSSAASSPGNGKKSEPGAQTEGMTSLEELAAKIAGMNLNAEMALILLKAEVEQGELKATPDQILEALNKARFKE